MAGTRYIESGTATRTLFAFHYLTFDHFPNSFKSFTDLQMSSSAIPMSESSAPAPECADVITQILMQDANRLLAALECVPAEGSEEYNVFKKEMSKDLVSQYSPFILFALISFS